MPSSTGSCRGVTRCLWPFRPRQTRRARLSLAILATDPSIIAQGSRYRFTAETSLYLHKTARRSGLGTAMLKHPIDHAIKKGNIHTLIGCMARDNHGSIAPHKRFGFTYEGVLANRLQVWDMDGLCFYVADAAWWTGEGLCDRADWWLGRA